MPTNRSLPATDRPIPRILSDTRHARAVRDPLDPRYHMAICGEGYPWPSTICLEPHHFLARKRPSTLVTNLVTCRNCVLAIEARRVPAYHIPPNSSDF
jgi:hypothetical protein